MGKRLIFVVDEQHVYTIPAEAFSLFAIVIERNTDKQQAHALIVAILNQTEEGRVTTEASAKLAAYIIDGFEDAKEHKHDEDNNKSKPA